MHKEIVDFYEFVKPRDFEEKIRGKLVENLRLALKRDGRNFANAQLFPFGSFVSGLYLPTADMDVVVCSESFMKGGDATYLSAKNWLYKFRKLLTSQRIANFDSIEVIAHARIPLVKYVDKATGLRVDVSFENLGGVRAVETFQRWKKEYPAMPALVTVIKHYLLMRGLNEPVNGGLGGFTVICLVVSMLQLMPEVQSGSLVPEHHLGEMLLEFLRLYGRDFSYRTNAISLVNPVGYIPKVRLHQHIAPMCTPLLLNPVAELGRVFCLQKQGTPLHHRSQQPYKRYCRLFVQYGGRPAFLRQGIRKFEVSDVSGCQGSFVRQHSRGTFRRRLLFVQKATSLSPTHS